MLRKLGVAGVAVFLLSVLVRAQADPFTGTWTLNTAKSKITSGLFKGQTLIYEPVPNGVKLLLTTVDMQGKSTPSTYTATFDGKDTPFTGNPYGAETISLKRIDANTMQATWKKTGNVIVTSRRVVSADGKSMTITTNGKTADGKAVNDTSIFDKK